MGKSEAPETIFIYNLEPKAFSYSLPLVSSHKEDIVQMKQIFFKDFIYLFERRERESTLLGAGAEGEADPPPSREPDAGLNPGTPGPQPEPKGVTQPTEPPKCPETIFLKLHLSYYCL